jgi:hypothetical protein
MPDAAKELERSIDDKEQAPGDASLPGAGAPAEVPPEGGHVGAQVSF